jgi:predicted MFS family arabinose efflux permease
VFVLRSQRITRPLLDLSLFRNSAYSAASIVSFFLGAALFGAMILMPLYFQEIRHQDAIDTGLLLIPQGLGGAVGMWLSGRATTRIGAGRTAVIGALIMIVATIPYVAVTANTSYLLISGAMLIRGVGVGLAIMPAFTAAFSVLEPDQINDASPQLTVLQRVGGSLGTALIAVVLQKQTEHAATVSAAASGFANTYWVVMAMTVVALVPTVFLMRIERRTRRQDAELAALTAAADAPRELETV